MATLKISGSVIDAETRKGMADLRAEAWGRIVGAKKKLGATTTDADGHFLIEFSLSDKQLSQKPLGVINIFSGKTLLYTTTEKPIAEWAQQEPDLVIELKPPEPPEKMVQFFITASLQNGEAAAGVQLVFNYELADGGTWTSQPKTANANGKLTVDIPEGAVATIDWSRVGFAFSMNGKLLRIIERTQPEPVEGGFAIAVKLEMNTILWPPEQDPNKWYIRGKVSTASGEALRAEVSAAAIHLSGEKALGKAQTSDTGRYEIIYEWDDDCLPDVQVFAHVQDKPLAQSGIYFSTGKSIRIDLIQDNETYIGPTEFQRVEEKIRKCNQELDIAKVGVKQFEYLLGKTRLAQETLSSYLVALKLASLCDVPAEVFFGLFRAKLPGSLQGLVIQTPKVLQDALDASLKRNIIDRKYKDALDPLIEALRQLAVEGSLNNNQQLDHAGMSDLLTVAGVPTDAHANLVNHYFEHDGNDASFWEAVSADQDLAKYANTVKSSLQAGALAMYHLPTVQQLKNKLGEASEIKDLAQWREPDWQAFGKGLASVPDIIVGKSKEERVRNYVGSMQRNVKRAFAREYTTANVLRSDTFASPILREFLVNTPDFDYANSSIPAVLDQVGIAGEQRVELEKTLQGIQRLYRIAPLDQKFEVVESLYADGVTSARDITRLGEAQFTDTYTDSLGGVENARFVFHNAATVTSVSTNLLTSYGEMFHATDLYAIGGGINIPQPNTQDDLAIPSYQDLFGSQSFCECQHCGSVYSPAAYFVDLLEYLRTSLVTRRLGGANYVKIVKDGRQVNKTGLDVLFERRADLGDIRLDCKNTNTVLPYIDLVNENFERAVIGETDSTTYQTSWTDAELRANPEHILSEAYDVLAQNTYPLTLPFRLWNLEAETYLDHIGVARWNLMETVLQRPDTTDDGFDQVCFAYLGLTEMDVEILKGAAEYSESLAAVGNMWGYSDTGWRIKLAQVPEFLNRSGLNYDELRQLLQVEFINIDGQLGIDFSEAETACDINGAVLRYADGESFNIKKRLTKQTCDHIQRFLRLRLKTGWSIWELGRVLSGLNASRLNIQVLIQVSVLKRLVDTLNLDVIEAASLWATLDTALDETDPDYRSFYDSVFLNPAVLNPADEIFQLHEDRDRLQAEDDGNGWISENLPAIAAAMQITETEATLLAETLPITGRADLTLANLSQLYRMALLCRIKDIAINDYLLLMRLVDAEWSYAGRPRAILKLLEAIDTIKTSDFSVVELAYLLLHDEASVTGEQLDSVTVGGVLTEIQDSVQAVWAQYALSNTPGIDQLRSRLGDYFEPSDIDLIINLTGQQEVRSTEDNDYLLETLDFLTPRALNNAVDQGQTADLRYARLLELLNIHARNAGSTAVVAQIIAETFALDLSATELIVTEVTPRPGRAGEFAIHALVDPLFIESGKEKLAAAIDAEYWQDAFAIIEGGSSMSVAEVEDFIEQQFTFLNAEEAKTQLVGVDALVDTLARYQYVTSPLDDSQYQISEEVFDEQFNIMRRLQKTALLVGKFDIGHTELPALHDYAQALHVLPLADFPFVETENNFPGFNDWLNLFDALRLRELFTSADTDLFAQLEKIAVPDLIDISSTNEEIDALIDSGEWSEAERPLLVWLYELSSATGWSLSALRYVVGPDMLGLALADMLNIANLSYIRKVVELAEKLGAGIAQINAWASLDLSQTDAGNAKQAARGRYPLEQWYDVAAPLRDVLREKQRDALVAHMLHTGGFSTTTALYDHYLFDSEMSACMLTSRIKLALSSTQLFLQRCLLNLEQEFVQVDQPAQWEWRKNYRVWEANRKVFLYPESFLEPELRSSRTEIFDAAQSILLQKAVTQEVAEQSLLHYLEVFDEVSNVEIIASYHEQTDAIDGIAGTDRLHVVARTRGIPHTYFYRCRDGKRWSAWEEIDVDINAEQVLPVVIDSRLYLFWPVFFEKQATGSDVLSSSTREAAIRAQIEEENDDEYLDYLLNYEWFFNSSIGQMGMSLQEGADYFGLTIDELINLMVNTHDAKSRDEFYNEFFNQEKENLDKKFSGTFNYFEIKISVSEHKNGNWTPSHSSDVFLESDKSRYAIALLDDRLPSPVPADFSFLTQVENDVVVIECVQTLRYSDGNTYHFDEGHFKYDIFSKNISASESQYDVGWLDLLEGLLGASGNRAIISPTGTMLVGNAFLEDKEPKLEIPEISENTSTNFIPLIYKTPGPFQIPIQHQYNQFTASDIFFFGDDKHSYTVSKSIAGAKYKFNIPQTKYYLNKNLYDYLESDTPGVGVYSEFIGLSDASTKIENVGFDRPNSDQKADVKNSSNIDARLMQKNFDAIAHSFSDVTVNQFFPVVDHVYRFESFYHPLSGSLIRNINGAGIPEALSRDTQCIVEDYFESYYEPTEQTEKTYPRRLFGFSNTDAYGSYNYELFFHLPLMIATRLSKNQQFAEAQQWFHYIFDPTSRANGEGAQRFWQFKPFFDMYDNEASHPFDSIYTMLYTLSMDPVLADANTLALKEQIEEQISVMKTDPFNPHAIAALRPVAYMKNTVMKYLDNLIDWGDYLYQQYTHESINEATQLYLLAYQILGERPVALPELETVASSYNELGEVDAFSNALTVLENYINLSIASGNAVITIPPLYFCIPNNPNLLQYWDTVEDRLFKIRHCMTIEGIVQQLPLFQPPINPALLVRARAGGVSIGAALASLATPAPYYRFVYLMQKAVEYCQVVKGLGSQLLAAYEKKDAEELGLIRAEHEESLLKASTELRNLQVDEARENLAALEKSKGLIKEKIDYYSDIEKRSEKEKAAIDKANQAETKRIKSSDKEKAASLSNLFPNISVSIPPSTSTSFGGSNIGASLSADAAKFRGESAAFTHEASKIGTDAGYDRRWDDWKLQERLATKELEQVEKQLLAAEVRLALAEKERDNHAIQLEQSREVRDFFSNKFTNKELYGWMISQISAIYFQSYQLAYDLATRCEKAFQRETGEYDKSFIAYGHFDSMKKGLLAGDRLHHELQRMEFDYLNTNRREFELSKTISLAQLDPSALIALRETGECFINLPEMLFNLDYPGHYFRRIKSVSLSIPSITGPYTNLSSTLTLQSDKLRVVAKVDEGESDDNNLRFNLGNLSSMATSSAQNDAGTFQMDFRDERYLPFEGAGVISEWKLALNDPQLAQFDYSTISDVIMHINYTARDGGEVFRTTVEESLLSAVDDFFGTDQQLQQLISVKQTMADEWARLANTAENDNYLISVDLGLNNFPYYLRARGISITSLKIVLSGKAVVVSGLGDVELPDFADSEGTTPYTVSFSEDPALKLASANFEFKLPVGAEPQSIAISLPGQLVNAVNSAVTDVFIICDYKILALADNP